MNAPAKTDDNSTSLSQTSLTNYGFKRAYGNAASGYVLMFDGVGNESGRRIYVPGGSLGMHFAKLVKMQGDHTEKLILTRLSRLRSCAGGFQSYSNKHDAFEHIDIVENLRISYIIRQDSAGGLGPGVYITDIEFVSHAEGHVPGLYHVKKVKGEWQTSKNPDNKIETSHAAINGRARNMENAAKEIIPNVIAGGYGDSGSQIDSEGYTLAYNPRPLYSRGTEWTTPEAKMTSADFTAQLVAKSLYEAQVSGKEVKWTIHGDGADLMLKALDKLPRHFKLNKHTIYLGGPTKAALGITDHVRLREMKLSDDYIKTQSDDFLDVYAKTQQMFAVSKRMMAWGEEYETLAYRLKGQARKDRNIAIVQGGIALKAGISMGGVIAAVSGGISPLWATYIAAGGAAGLCSSLFFLYRNAELIRNLFASHTMNPEINPHMQPATSSVNFNAAVEKKYKGLGRSFFGVIKELGNR